jgi:hypothetical protein
MIINRRRRNDNPLDKGIFVALSFFVICFILYFSGFNVKMMIKWGLFGVCAVGFLLYFVNKIVSRMRARRERLMWMAVDTSVYDRKRYEALERKQAEAATKSASYEEKVVKPREEEKLKRAEEELKSVSRHWKLGGHKLGRLDDESEHLDVTEQDVPLLESEEDEPTHQLRFRGVKRSDSQEAAGRRRLNVSQDLLSQSSLSSSPQKDSSRGGDVCEGGEVGEDGDGVVTIAMKLPNQQVVQKKFSQVAKISELYTWLEELGWQTEEFEICSTYPRKHFNNQELTLSEAGIREKRCTVVAEYL